MLVPKITADDIDNIKIMLNIEDRTKDFHNGDIVKDKESGQRYFIYDSRLVIKENSKRFILVPIKEKDIVELDSRKLVIDDTAIAYWDRALLDCYDWKGVSSYYDFDENKTRYFSYYEAKQDKTPLKISISKKEYDAIIKDCTPTK